MSASDLPSTPLFTFILHMHAKKLQWHPNQAPPRVMHTALGVLGVGALAVVCIFSSAAPGPSVLLHKLDGDLSQQLVADSKLLASLNGVSTNAPQRRETAAQHKERTTMMSKFGQVPASWCAPDSPECEDMDGYA